jgi:hypothetical protein
MNRRATSEERLRHRLQPASDGVGPLVQRDYWCVIQNCRMRPRELLLFVRAQFPELPPEELADFEPCRGPGPLELGDEMSIDIPGAGTVTTPVLNMALNHIPGTSSCRSPDFWRVSQWVWRRGVSHPQPLPCCVHPRPPRPHGGW